MNRPWYQRLLTFGTWMIVGFVGLGSILDTISNSITTISPIITYIGTGLVILFTVIIVFLLRFLSLPWITNDSQKVRLKSLGQQPVFAVAGVLIALWVPRLAEVWKDRYGAQPQPNLSLSCDIDREFPVVLNSYHVDQFFAGKEEPTPIDFGDKPASNWSNYFPETADYSHLLSFFVKCRITNLSNKNISIEDIRPFLRFIVGQPSYSQEQQTYFLSYEHSFQGVFKNANEPMELPRLLQQGEQVVVFVKTGWLLHRKFASDVTGVFDKLPKPITMDRVFKEFSATGGGLNEMAWTVLLQNGKELWIGQLIDDEHITNPPRTLNIEVKAADGSRVDTIIRP